MKYIIDNDLHIHSKTSLCSNDPLHTTERILQYAESDNLKKICLTDHFWDDNVPGASGWYEQQNYAHISEELPLPQKDGIRFLFGCETEMDKYFNIGISEKSYDKFDFIIIPTTHMHMTDFTISKSITSPSDKAECWLERLNRILDMDLPFHKIGIAHLTCHLMDHSREKFLEILENLKDSDLKNVFTKAAKTGVGIELNSSDMKFKDSEADTVLRIYKTAKDCGCKFYLGSDAHHPNELDDAKAIFERAINLLDLSEDDKFILA